MYRFALCDDEQFELKKTEALLEAYKQAHPEYDFAVQQFNSVDSLLAASPCSGGFDLLILDVYMPGKSGIQGAKELRAQGEDCQIIFMTSSVAHAVDAFGVDAVQYLVKPVDEEKFFSAMDKAVLRIDEVQRRYIAIRLRGEMRRVALYDIVYCESHGNYQHLILTDESEVRVRMTMSELHATMGNTHAFVRVGSAYLANLSHVDSMNSKEILFDNEQRVGVPRGAYSALREEYFDFYCSGKEKGK